MTLEPVVGEPRDRQYRFGEFVLDVENGFLRRHGEEISLRPKALGVLIYLVLHHGNLVTKDELVEAVWPDTAVTDNSLSQCLVEIRRALNDDAQAVIRTVARRGYIFDAPVSVLFSDLNRNVSEVATRIDVADTPQPAPIHDLGNARSDTCDPRILESRLHNQGQVATAAPRTLRPTWRLAAGVVLLLVGIGAVLALREGKRWAPDAESPVQLTDFNDSAVFPALSHDGLMMTFVRPGFFGAVGAPRGQVYVKILPSGSLIQLTRDSVPKAVPVFSPDDSRIVYTTVTSGLRWDSWQVPVLGGIPQPFLPNASGVVWLDERRLIYSTIMAGIHMGIASSTESRSAYREIYFPSREDGMAHRSAPSPNGKSLLIVEMNGGTWLPCRLLSVDGSSVGRPVGPQGSQCTSAAWSPDGRWMYFSSNAGGAYHVWRQRYPDGAPEQVTFGPTEQEGTAITPDGKYLITSMGLQQASIWINGPDGERKLTDEGYATQPTIVPSGTRMFYLQRANFSRGMVSGELWSMDLVSGIRQRALPGLVMANYSLSQDGSKVVFTSAGNEKRDGVWIAPLDRHSPPRLLVGGTDIRAFYGGPGEIVYMGVDRHLYRMKEDGSGIEMISPDPVAYLSTVSPDGRWAVVILPEDPNGVGTTSLWFMSLKGGKSFAVCNDACVVGPRSFLGAPPFAWTMDGKWLFVNLIYFGKTTQRTVVLPYRPDGLPQTLWPRGLRRENDIVENPGAKVINAGPTSPASDAGAYLFSRNSTQSNLYRIRLPN
jgi:DNA-binding winged helix-turn-helix (wHTH) protein/Tol biopolymer transport system component